jgi:hypothetical protein
MTGFLSLELSYLRHKWIESISASGCLWPSRVSLSKKAPQGVGPCDFY